MPKTAATPDAGPDWHREYPMWPKNKSHVPEVARQYTLLRCYQCGFNTFMPTQMQAHAATAHMNQPIIVLFYPPGLGIEGAGHDW